MKTVDRRIRILKLRFGMNVEATRNAVPTAPQMMVERLVAGEWECALKLLELPGQNVWQEWQSSVQLGTSPNRMHDIDFRDLTSMRQKLTSSVADLPPELRWEIARQLFAADIAGHPGTDITRSAV
jgi:hypothetical protein